MVTSVEGNKSESKATLERRRIERRNAEKPARDYSGTERRKTERRRQIDPTTCERDYGSEEIAFMTAMDDYKRRAGRQFPTWSEVLEVLHSMGYRKVAEPTELPG